jgi:hypothetical protein
LVHVLPCGARLAWIVIDPVTVVVCGAQGWLRARAALPIVDAIARRGFILGQNAGWPTFPNYCATAANVFGRTRPTHCVCVYGARNVIVLAAGTDGACANCAIHAVGPSGTIHAHCVCGGSAGLFLYHVGAGAPIAVGGGHAVAKLVPYTARDAQAVLCGGARHEFVLVLGAGAPTHERRGEREHEQEP